METSETPQDPQEGFEDITKGYYMLSPAKWSTHYISLDFENDGNAQG